MSLSCAACCTFLGFTTSASPTKSAYGMWRYCITEMPKALYSSPDSRLRQFSSPSSTVSPDADRSAITCYMGEARELPHSRDPSTQCMVTESWLYTSDHCNPKASPFSVRGDYYYAETEGWCQADVSGPSATAVGHEKNSAVTEHDEENINFFITWFLKALQNIHIRI